MEYDYLIIGQGLAGSCFALTAIERGRKVLVVDSHEENISSNVAAGLYNPITGKNWVKTWLADEIFPFAEGFYQRYQESLRSKFLFKIPIYRPFSSLEIQNEWMGKSADSAYSSYVNKIVLNSQHSFLEDPLGGIYLNHSGRLDVPVFINGVKDYLNSISSLQNGKVNLQELKLHSDDGFQFDGKKFKNIIDARGVGAIGQFWKNVKFKPVKGEILEIKTDVDNEINFIPNRGVFMVPFHDTGYFKVGSTYEHVDLSLDSTEKGRNQIVEKLENLFSGNYVIKKQIVGIRPAVVDRRPVLGQHPEVSNLYIFNGLGAKGVTLSPYFAEQLLDFIEFRQELRSEVDIKRFL